MQSTQLTTLTGIILGLEFAAFGWRVNREINVGEGDRKTWLPLPDVVNIVALLMVVYLCIVVPLAHGDYTLWSRRVLAAAGTLIAFHPLVMAAHYGLPYRKQRPKKKNGDFQYAPIEEVLNAWCLRHAGDSRRTIRRSVIKRAWAPDNTAPQRTAIPLRFITAAELGCAET